MGLGHGEMGGEGGLAGLGEGLGGRAGMTFSGYLLMQRLKAHYDKVLTVCLKAYPDTKRSLRYVLHRDCNVTATNYFADEGGVGLN